MTTRPHGLTLIELLVALAVFAVLGTLSYRGVAQLAASRAMLGNELERWRAVERTLNIVEADLLQIAAPSAVPGDKPALASKLSGNGGELQFLSLSGAGVARRVGFRHRDGRLEWLRWPARDLHEAAAVDTLLDAVDDVRWRFVGAAGWSDRWPASATGGNALPAGIELQLDLHGIGTITRLYALR